MWSALSAARKAPAVIGRQPDKWMTIHIYTAAWQPATKYRVPGIPHLFETPPRSLVFVECCRKMRYACNVELQVFYDLTRARCTVGKGCR